MILLRRSTFQIVAPILHTLLSILSNFLRYRQIGFDRCTQEGDTFRHTSTRLRHDPPKASPVNETGAITPQGCQVLRGAITLMASKTVLRMLSIQTLHDLIPGHLGHHGGCGHL